MSHFGDWVASSITNLCIQLTHSKIQDLDFVVPLWVKWVAIKELTSYYLLLKPIVVTIVVT